MQIIFCGISSGLKSTVTATITVCGLCPRGPWSATFPNMINFSSRKKIGRKMKGSMID